MMENILSVVCRSDNCEGMTVVALKTTPIPAWFGWFRFYVGKTCSYSVKFYRYFLRAGNLCFT